MSEPNNQEMEVLELVEHEQPARPYKCDWAAGTDNACPKVRLVRLRWPHNLYQMVFIFVAVANTNTELQPKVRLTETPPNTHKRATL